MPATPAGAARPSAAETDGMATPGGRARRALRPLASRGDCYDFNLETQTPSGSNLESKSRLLQKWPLLSATSQRHPQISSKRRSKEGASHGRLCRSDLLL